MLAVLVGRHGVFFGGIMIAVFVVMGRLVMMVSCGVMMSSSLQMMFGRFMFFGRGHGFLLQVMGDSLDDWTANLSAKKTTPYLMR
jgi:hypothetical protein